MVQREVRRNRMARVRAADRRTDARNRDRAMTPSSPGGNTAVSDIVPSLSSMRARFGARAGFSFAASDPPLSLYLDHALRSVLEPLQCLEKLGLPRHGRLAFFFFLLDDIFRRVGDKLLVGKLGIDTPDVGFGLGQLLV